MAYLLLAGTILAELVSVNLMKVYADTGNKLWIPPIVLGYIACYAMFTLCLTDLPLGYAYAAWGGLGSAATVVIAWFLWKEPPNARKWAGVVLVIVGIVVLNVGVF